MDRKSHGYSRLKDRHGQLAQHLALLFGKDSEEVPDSQTSHGVNVANLVELFQLSDTRTGGILLNLQSRNSNLFFWALQCSAKDKDF